MSAQPDVEPWKLELSERLILGAAHAAIQATPEDEHKALHDTLDDVGDFADSNGGMTDRLYFAALMGLAKVAYKVAPDGAFGDQDGPLELVAEDTVTGGRVADPDADLTEDVDDETAATGRGTLAAMRFFTAVANDDDDTAAAVFFSIEGHAAGVFLHTLLRYCGSIVADWMHREGKFSPDADAMWQARRDADEAAAPPAVERTVRHDPGTGLDFVRIPVDDRDQHPDDRAVIAPHGDAVYAMTMYRRGTPGHRENAIATAVQAASSTALTTPGTVLCGVEHSEDIEVHDLPHAARRTARRAMRDAARMAGGTWQLVRTWQHYGSCPDESRAPGANDVPLFDVQDGDDR